ncbi:MAG: uroporphyrinogen decarboxylase family protein [Candidatus Helarchaeota archaeon]
MIGCEDRVLSALEFKKTDRIPICDNALQIYPAVKSLIFYHLFPPIIKKRLDNLYFELISSIRQFYGIERKSPKRHWLLRLMGNRLDSLLQKFLASPISDDVHQRVKTLRLYYDSCVRLGLDLISLPIFPSVNIKALLKRDGINYLITDDYGLFTVDKSGDLKGIGVVFENDLLKQIKAYKSALKNFNIENIIELYSALYKVYNEGKKLTFSIALGGFFETWFCVFGYIKNGMINFIKQVFKEHRSNLKGPYIDLLRYKCEVYCKIIKCLSEVNAKIVFLGEDCAIDSGPIIGNNIYSTYFAPLIKKLTNVCHKYNMKMMFHSDGRFNADNYQLLDTIVSTGIDALHPLQSNVIIPSDLRRRYEHLCLCGGIDCTKILQSGSVQQVYEAVAKIIKTTGKYGLILGSDNSIHSGIKIENYLALARATRFYGRF